MSGEWSGAEILERAEAAYAALISLRAQAVGAHCFKVVREVVISRDMLWIDSDSFLLRQMRQEQNASPLAGLFNSAREQRPDGEEDQPDSMVSSTSMMSLHVFAIGSLSQPLDASLFQNPEPQ